MFTIIGYFAVLVLIAWSVFIINAMIARVPLLASSRQLIYFAFVVWVAVTIHRAAIWIPSFKGVGGYDGTSHDRVAHEIARGLTSGRLSIFDLSILSNAGYRNALGTFYALTNLPSFAVVAIHAMMAFFGLLFILEAVCRLIARPVPGWLVLYTLLLPSAIIFTPWLLKEGPILWGIGLLLRFSISPTSYLRLSFDSFVLLLGALTVFLLRPHIGGAWVIAIAAGHFTPGRRPGFALISMTVGLLFFGLTIAAAEWLRPGFLASAEQIGVVDTLDRMTDHARGGSAIYREATPIPFLNGVLFIMFEPNPLTWGKWTYAIVGLEAWFISVMMIIAWSGSTQKVKMLFSPPAIISIVAILAIGFYLGYMYNMGLMVRQRLQVLPAIIVLTALPLRRTPYMRDSIPAQSGRVSFRTD